jgi:hypothetical protein
VHRELRGLATGSSALHGALVRLPAWWKPLQAAIAPP